MHTQFTWNIRSISITFIYSALLDGVSYLYGKLSLGETLQSTTNRWFRSNNDQGESNN